MNAAGAVSSAYWRDRSGWVESMGMGRDRLECDRNDDGFALVARYRCRLSEPAAVLLAVCLTMGGCGADAERRPEQVAAGSDPTPAAQTSPDRPSPDAGFIGPEGIGEARVGMSIGDLRAALPDESTIGPAAPFMVDIQALPIVRGADTLYYVLAGSDEPTGEYAPIRTVATLNESFRTAEGVGPGTTLAAAAAIYGPAKLRYNTEDESREYVSFAGYPSENVLFRARAAGDEFAMVGVYATQAQHNETAEYDPSALISMVIVSLQR
jgi:hypothetical protein